VNILVTGGAGFIGSHIADACIKEGHAVTIIDDLSMGKMENVNPKATFVNMDIRSKEIPQLFEKGKFQTVIHLAAQMDVRKSVDDPQFDASVNILGSVNLLEQSKRTGVKKFVFASTGGAIYGEQEYFPADEKHPLHPISPYGISKASIEKYLYYYKEVFGLQYVSLRFGNVYGPRQNPHGEAGVIAIFTSKMLAGEQPVINGDGKQTRDYVYVGDVVNANLFAITYEHSGIFNVGTGIETNVNQLFSILKEVTGSKCEEIHAPAKKGEQLRSVLNTTLLREKGNWKPRMELKEGLRQTVEFFRNKKK
jgi:UDP-glucose 4-epimerase